MAETTEKTGEKKLSVAPTKTLSLKGRGVEQGVVRQSFSHGRTKAVVVEKVKSRGPTRGKAEPAAPAAPAQRPAPGRVASAAPMTAPAPSAPGPALKPSGVVLRTLTEEERTARARALGDARLREAEERKIAEEEALIRKSRESVERASATPPRPVRPMRRSVANTSSKPSSRPSRRRRSGSARTPRRPQGPPPPCVLRSSPTRKRLRAFAAVRVERRARHRRQNRRGAVRRKVADGLHW